MGIYAQRRNVTALIRPWVIISAPVQLKSNKKYMALGTTGMQTFPKSFKQKDATILFQFLHYFL